MSQTVSSYDVAPSRPAVVNDKSVRGLPAARKLWGRNQLRILGAAAVLLGGLAVLRTSWNSIASTDAALILATVEPRDLPIEVTERGNLESQVKTEIICEVESFSFDRSSGVNGTQIIFIVPNGSAVKEGDLLVELDSAPIKDLMDTQVLATERARAEKIQAEVKYENQVTQNQTALKEAELQVKLAETELEMYTDEEDGTFQIELQNLKLQIEEAQNKILEALANLEMQEIEKNGTDRLHSLGYRGQGDMRQATLGYLRAQDSLVSAANNLANFQAGYQKLVQYQGPMEIMKLEGALATAKRALLQVSRDNDSLLAQAEAAKNAAVASLTKEEERLEKYRRQIAKCKITAPHDGMVVYAVDRRRETMIAEGAVVRQRQSILTLPNLSAMQVKTSIHESALDRVKVGTSTTVRVDAFPGRTYEGTVESVAVLPEQSNWLQSDIKVYETVVKIGQAVQDLKPGMTAVVEIHVDRLRNVLCVPVQAIVQQNRDSFCYVQTTQGLDRRPVKLGASNDKFVQIAEGIEAGEQVVLNPMTIAGLQEDDQGKEEDSDQGAAVQDETITEKAGVAQPDASA